MGSPASKRDAATPGRAKTGPGIRGRRWGGREKDDPRREPSEAQPSVGTQHLQLHATARASHTRVEDSYFVCLTQSLIWCILFCVIHTQYAAWAAFFHRYTLCKLYTFLG